jgi:hypothetical protein
VRDGGDARHQGRHGEQRGDQSPDGQ